MGPGSPDPRMSGMTDQEAFPLALTQYQQYMGLSVTGTVSVVQQWVLLKMIAPEVGPIDFFKRIILACSDIERPGV